MIEVRKLKRMCMYELGWRPKPGTDYEFERIRD